MEQRINRYRRHSDTVVRSCSRCRKELTDSASRECGVGPVCRKKDNAIFARQIPANLTLALVNVLELRADHFHTEINADFHDIVNLFLDKTEAARREFGDAGMATIPGADWRFIVDWLDMSLSYNTSSAHRNRVIGIIEDLGYVSLGSVLRGVACMSPATLSLEGDRLVLVGKSNKPGFLAMKAAFGRAAKMPRYRGDATPYSVHVSNAPKFVELALRHWPFLKNLDEVDNLLEQAAEVSANCEPEDVRPVARIEDAGLNVRVTVPWTGTREQMMTMFKMFKEVPRSERSFAPHTKAWTFKKQHVNHVKWAIERTELYRVTRLVGG